MKDISATERDALRLLITAGVYVARNVPASKTAERLKAACRLIMPFASDRYISVPPMDWETAETSTEDSI